VFGSDACSLAFVFRHGIENPNGSSGGNERARSPTILGGDFRAAGLTYMVDKLGCAVGGAGDAAERLRDSVDRHVVILADPVRGDEGVNYHHIELAGLERLLQGGLDGRCDQSPGLGLRGDDKLGVAPAVEEKPPFNIAALDLELQAGGHDTPINFLLWIFAIPVPNAQRLDRPHSKQIDPCRHRHGFNDRQGAFTNPARRDGRAQKLPDVVAPIDELPARERGGVAPCEGRRVELDRRLLADRMVGAVALLGVCPLASVALWLWIDEYLLEALIP
jgi:hypothetical protein